nr:hypothetical protein [Tanacetum cinerariifolium]
DVGVESIFTMASSPIVSLQTPTPIMTPSIIAPITTSSEAPIPTPTIPSIILDNLPTFNSAFCFEERLRSLETSFSEYRQTNQFTDAVSAIPGIVHQYMTQQMTEAVREAVQIQTDWLQDSLQQENDEFLRNIDENMKKIIKGQVKNQKCVPQSLMIARGVSNLAKRDFKNLQTTRASLVGSAFASTHFGNVTRFDQVMGITIDCGPVKTRVKHLFGGVVRAMMSPGGSIMASLENINGFLAVNTPPNDLICIDFKQEGVVQKVMLHIFKELVLLLGRHPLHNKVPRMVVCKIGKPWGT